MKLNLSERVRANSEAAPWVIDEVKAMEEELERLRAELKVAYAAGRMSVQREGEEWSKRVNKRWIEMENKLEGER